MQISGRFAAGEEPQIEYITYKVRTLVKINCNFIENVLQKVTKALSPSKFFNKKTIHFEKKSSFPKSDIMEPSSCVRITVSFRNLQP